jgi:SAM-dependent methyltransferase
MDDENILRTREELIALHGPWWDNFKLADSVWTNPSARPHPRAVRLLQIVESLAKKPLNQYRVLDLACASGHYALEFAFRGAEVVGIEGRASSVRKAEFARKVFELQNLRFLQDDVRNVSPEHFGEFDVVVCSGLLYHLPAEDLGPFVETLHALSTHLTLIDTHVALAPHRRMTYKGREYHGALIREHLPWDTDVARESRQRASIGNDVSFCLSRPSLVNLLAAVGFTSIFECLLPVVPGLADRCTIVALKSQATNLRTFSGAAPWELTWKEGDLSYPRRSRILAEIRWQVREGLARLGLLPTFRRWRRRFTWAT